MKVYKTSKCKRCNCVFAKTVHNKIYCTEKCQRRHEEASRNSAQTKKTKRIWINKNRDKVRLYSKRTLLKNPEKARIRHRRKIDRLSDTYIRTRLGLNLHNAPKELIEAKRQQLKLKRAIRRKIHEEHDRTTGTVINSF